VDLQSNQLKVTSRRLLAELYMKIKRSEEELDLLKRDMNSYLSFYRTKITELEYIIETESNNAVEIIMAKRGLSFAQHQLADGVQYFSTIFNAGHSIPIEFRINFEDDEIQQVEEETVVPQEDLVIPLLSHDMLKDLAVEVSSNFNIDDCLKSIDGNVSSPSISVKEQSVVETEALHVP